MKLRNLLGEPQKSSDVRANVRALIIPGARALQGKLPVQIPEDEFQRIVELAVDAFIVDRLSAMMVLEREFGLHHFVWVDPFAVMAELERIREAA